MEGLKKRYELEVMEVVRLMVQLEWEARGGVVRLEERLSQR